MIGMGALAGPFVVAALILGLGGALEMIRPAATVGAMRAMGLPSSPLAVRVGAVAAVVVSAVAVVWPARAVALAVAVAYVFLSGFVLAALLRRTPLGSCGCFGRDDTPATTGHLVVNVGAAVVAAAVAVGPGPRGWESARLESRPLVVVLFAVFTVTATAFTYLSLTVLPRLAGAARPTAGRTT